jgi:class 3 adenylate cyclase
MTTRRLAAILAADMVGYSPLEEGTLARLQVPRSEVIDPAVVESGGRIVKSTGDGILAEYPSAVEAVRCAVDMQTEIRRHEEARDPEQRIEFRIGIKDVAHVRVDPLRRSSAAGWRRLVAIGPCA